MRFSSVFFDCPSFFHFTFGTFYHFCLSALSFLPICSVFPSYLLLSGLAGRMTCRKIIIKNGSFLCLTGCSPPSSIYFTTVRFVSQSGKQYYFRRKGEVFKTGFSKHSTDLLKDTRLHKASNHLGHLSLN